MKEFYNIENENGLQTKVLVHKSEQHIYSERILTIGKSALKRLNKLGKTWYAIDPTPYYPRCVFIQNKI
jgi:hypothetical protein